MLPNAPEPTKPITAKRRNHFAAFDSRQTRSVQLLPRFVHRHHLQQNLNKAKQARDLYASFIAFGLSVPFIQSLDRSKLSKLVIGMIFACRRLN